MKLKENMYIRTKDGYISQYRYYDATKGKLLCMPLSDGTFANIDDIKKASYNIIDILEIGDYVNGVEAIAIDDEWITMSDICPNEEVLCDISANSHDIIHKIVEDYFCDEKEII